jgi:hypothetical protein
MFEMNRTTRPRARTINWPVGRQPRLTGVARRVTDGGARPGRQHPLRSRLGALSTCSRAPPAHSQAAFGAGPTGMVKSQTVGIEYVALRKECLDAVRHWPGCESIAGIQIIRGRRTGSFSVKITLYGTSDMRKADRAIACVQREKRRQFHLIE